MNRAYLLGGLPGAGKSLASKFLKTMSGGTVLESGQVVRDLAMQDGLTNPTSHELGQWSGQKRDADGQGYVEDAVIEMIESGEYDPEGPLIYDGVRNATGLRTMRDYFPATCFIWIHAPPAVRLERLQDRGRDDESDFTMADLEERDRIEIEELGAGEILGTNLDDHVVPNTGTMEDLESQLQAIAHVFREQPA